MRAIRENKRGIYIHIPFCIKKCLYCDFASYVESEDIHQKYVQMLCREINSSESFSADTIFIGGGTPSSIDPLLIKKIMDTLYGRFDITDRCEITLEANPGTISENSAKIYKSSGISRISMGLQSHDDNILKLLGRIHTFDDFVKSLKILRKEGFENINADVMFALPGQTPEIWLETLKRVCGLGIEHISAYGLMIEKNTPFYDIYNEEYPVDDETDRLMYHKAVEFLKEKGFERYEISNFSKKGFESRHNMKYWSGGEYIGFGAAASSYDGVKRYSNTKSLSDYLRGKTKCYEEILSQNQKIEEFMFLGLRKNSGISLSEFQKKFKCGIFEKYPVINSFINDGFIIRDGDSLKLSSRGIDICDSIFVEFML